MANEPKSPNAGLENIRSIKIPTDTMEQEFQNHYRRGYEAGKSAAQPVPVVGEPVGFVLLHEDGGKNLTFHDNTGELSDGWSQHKLVIQPAHSITSAELASLREKAAMADELQKDAEKWRDLCSRVGVDPSGAIAYAGPLEGAPEDWAAIAQEIL